MKKIRYRGISLYSHCKIINFIMLTVIVTGAMFLSPGVEKSFAAPYGPKDVATVHDRMYESDLVIYGKIVRKEKKKVGKKYEGITEVEVYDVLKGEGWKKGDYFYINAVVKNKDKSVGLFYLVKSFRGDQEIIQFNKFYPDNRKQMFQYSKKIKSYMDKNDDTGRIRWLFTRVDSPNSLVAWDAFAQLGQASYRDLKKAAPYIDRDSLQYLMASPDMSDTRRSFYAFLLGLGGDPEDKLFIDKVIKNPKNKDSKVLYGAMMGYGLLAANYPSFYLSMAKANISTTMNLAILEAVRNLMEYERPPNPEPLMRSYYYLLQHGNSKVVLKALQVARELKLTGPIRYMRSLYSAFRNDSQVKIAAITYLKFVRKIPSAAKLLEELKRSESDPKVRKYFSL